MTPRKLCMKYLDSDKLYHFACEVFNYDFSEVPDYSKLRFLLCKILLAQEVIPDSNFVWSFIKKHSSQSVAQNGAENLSKEANEFQESKIED
jgi:hypothetical protein